MYNYFTSSLLLSHDEFYTPPLIYISDEMPKSMTTLTDMEERIGQGAFESPSVFSFFLPEFPAPGVIQSAGLVAPEGMVLQGDNILSLLDSFFSTIKFGITAHTCYGWGGRMSSFDAWDHRSVSVLFFHHSFIVWSHPPHSNLLLFIK